MLTAMEERMGDRAVGPTMISVSSEPPGLVLTVHGPLDDPGCDLLADVVRAGLATVERADRLHLDLRNACFPSAGLPRIVRRLAKAGARVTAPATTRTASGGTGAASSEVSQ